MILSGIRIKHYTGTEHDVRQGDHAGGRSKKLPLSEIHRRLQEYENSILDSPGEQGQVFTPTGEVIKGEGFSDKVAYDRKDIPKMKNGYLTHNHPKNVSGSTLKLEGGWSFSSKDVRFAIGANLKEMRAVGTIGKKRFLYRIVRTGSEWGISPDSLSEFTENWTSDYFDKHCPVHGYNNQVDYLKRLPKRIGQKFQEDVHHEMWVAASQEFGFTYERSEF